MSVSAVDNALRVAMGQVYGASKTCARSTEQAGANASTGDFAALSPLGLRLSSLFDTQPGKPITGADLRMFADKKLKEFAARFKALLEANGIDTSAPITLGHEPGTGRVIVTSNHPDADKINGLLADDFDLSNTYTAATSTLEILRQGQEHQQFADAYAKDPQAAVARFSYLFNTRWNADVTFTGDRFDIAYTRSPRGR